MIAWQKDASEWAAVMLVPLHFDADIDENQGGATNRILVDVTCPPRAAGREKGRFRS
jgi:hypothetical protein